MDKNEGIKKVCYDAERRESSKIMKDIYKIRAGLKIEPKIHIYIVLRNESTISKCYIYNCKYLIAFNCIP